MDLTGRTALITGGARNIGRAIAEALAAGGAAVAINARTSLAEAEAAAAAIEAAGGTAHVVPGDITSERDVAAIVAATVARFGGLDILVNNAAVRREVAIDELDLPRWREAMAVMLDGPFLCIKAALPYLRKSSAGTIVNIGGMTAASGARQRAHVVSAKAGLEGLTRALALDLAPDRITVNCVSPGLIGTVRDPALPLPATHKNRTLPLGQLAPPVEVAAMVRHLCGPAARFITGQVIHVNGGNYLGG
ncbi:MAG TPA: SDR family NAD(P)-dependent oxidoreductase [Stellaceae bacterium]|nr:SDR family NAD(P)-dependent oxidoreductase [Stellaceae bacterium]